ncbi:MAG: NAD(P)H-dependent oxidoreductase subunit E [Chloroflexi bacterium]|nr:NAD(P)H-dependent oxidoreductase subunit E [Chloroflexota bacterium]
MKQKELRRELVERFPRERQYLLPALHYIQHELGHLPEFALQVVGWHLHVPASEVYGAATSYTELRIDSPHTHSVRVCTGLACRLAGADDVLEACGAFLAPTDGAIPGAEVTLEETACGFLCAVGPAAQFDGQWHGRLDGQAARSILTAFGAGFESDDALSPGEGKTNQGA